MGSGVHSIPPSSSSTGGRSSFGYDRSIDSASIYHGSSIHGSHLSTHSRNRSIGGQSIAPALAAVMLVNRSPARKRAFSNTSNTSEALGAIRVFTGADTDIELSDNMSDQSGTNPLAPSNGLMGPVPLVNYHRHRNTANVLRRVMAYQFLAGRFCMDLDEELRTCLEQLHCLDNPTVNALSREREPPPRRSATIDH
ncbi:hypothetical protein BDF19DRAFT_142577 [Syncephalis fuscata]|nr:hypothetical protein BDF19DRAFT_142577 [Syncephalis fuscata]